MTLVYGGVAALWCGALDDAERWCGEALTKDAGTPTLAALAAAALARCRVALGRGGEARELAARAVAVLEGESVEEGESYIGLAEVEVLEAVGDHDGAVAALRRALARLELYVAQIADPSLRRSFLERVLENRALLDRAREWGVPAPSAEPPSG